MASLIQKRIQLSLIVILISFPRSFTWKFFQNGRISGGNLGSPRGRGGLFFDIKHISEEWFSQKLDHFNPTNIQEWKQRYFVNDGFYKNDSNGPVFLLIGGEAEITVDWMSSGSWVDYGREYNALLFQLEHRFYGKSHPTEDLSDENLVYLSSEQALLDLSNFINAKNLEYGFNNDVKWIVFGGSYSGSLAAWLRLKYPHFVQGAMSSSGPLLAKIDFGEYFQVVVDSLSTYSPECVTSVQQGTQQVELLLKKPIGQKKLDRDFNLCDPIEQSLDNSKDISNFFGTLAGNFAGVVQYSGDNRIGGLSQPISIGDVCDLMINEDLGLPIERLANVNQLILNSTDQSCLDYKYDNMIEALKNTSWDSSAGERQWTYQTCTEFGFYQTSAKTKVFGNKFPVQFSIDQCTDIFGEKYNANLLKYAVERTNEIYGGLNIETSNVVFVQGSIDPWHPLGINKALKPGETAIYINGVAHCANLYPKSKNDPPQLTEARKQIDSLIGEWLNQ